MLNRSPIVQLFDGLDRMENGMENQSVKSLNRTIICDIALQNEQLYAIGASGNLNVSYYYKW